MPRRCEVLCQPSQADVGVRPTLRGSQTQEVMGSGELYRAPTNSRQTAIKCMRRAAGFLCSHRADLAAFAGVTV